MQHQDDGPVLARLARLKAMTVNELKSEWQTLMGSTPPNNSRTFLEQRLAYRIQELTYGGLPKPVSRLLDALADEVEGKKVRSTVISDPRNPVIGTRLVQILEGAPRDGVAAAARGRATSPVTAASTRSTASRAA